MPRLIWAPSALLDVQRVYRFLASKNMDAASQAVKAIRAGVKIIARHPEIGRPAEDLEPECREWPIGFGDSGYVVLYRQDGELVTVLALRHQKEVSF
ncbi:type II toxin-antitoxin system RelE/ParE family toxin [Thiobacillus sp.]|uniref:type II toxin-antitoxin system RelE/ParE family toxin n=1 Tax=Thiobacillus sp. TaxID=924 RepID=UPI0025FE81C3|nr:type II toxin-antitoxin system RelE/ParE family toxin [Thiobacillus sp.]